MYNFVDTTEVSDGVLLPSEALKINGQYIENLIPGYRTLHVSGREALSPELSLYETGTRDGSVRKSKRYPARIIIVTYQIKAESNEAFRSAYNTLGSILDVEDAELIFNDETDKFFIGTPSAIGEVEPGSNIVVGEFEIICADPFKYSVEEYEAEALPTAETDEEGNIVSGRTFVVNYGGTYKAFPTLEADFYSESEADGSNTTALTGNGDCGFVAFFNENGKIIQLGDPTEVNGEDVEPSQTLVSQTFSKASSWGEAAQSLWATNKSVNLLDGMAQVGSMRMDSMENRLYLKANNYGSGNAWHGTTITRTIPADEMGEVGASNFTFTYGLRMGIGDNSNAGQVQHGSFQALLVSGSGDGRKILAGVNISKVTPGKSAKMTFYINGKDVETMNIDLSLNNIYFGQGDSVKTCIIKKLGDTVSFNIGGIKKTFTHPDIVDSQVKEVTFAFGRYRTMSPLTYNGIMSAKFVKDNCTNWRNIPNKFSADDIVVAECKSGEVFLNNAPTPEFGALGNDWENFYLQPGLNQIGVAYSDWLTDEYVPTFKLRYREVFL